MSPRAKERATNICEWITTALVVGCLVVALLAVGDVAAAGKAHRCFGRGITYTETTDRFDLVFLPPTNDVVRTRRGADIVTDTGGHDRICGGRGNDRIDAGPGFDRVDGGPGRDICRNAEITRRCEVTPSN